MRGLLVFIGACAVLLAVATTNGLSGTVCVGDHNCLVVNGDGVHVVDKTAAQKLSTTP
jgi:hypothetical protein